MKNYLFSFLVLLVIVSGCAILKSSLSDEGEIYTGTGQGYRGQITVQVWMNANQITDIVVDSVEDRFVGAAAMEELAELVITYNSTDIDTISGATISSRGFLEAVENAILNK